ncbi:MAG: sugar phosphate isomerase/epimerase [Lentisphaerae bacterium]|nr:sugar phosphate isomerase/epimerase [Lentisphaerota bacterium]
MPKPVALQLYTVRQLADKDFEDTLRRIAAIGYVGVEFAGLHGRPATDVAKLLRELGLRASSAHVALPTAANIESIAQDARTLGYRHIVGGSDPKTLLDRAGVEACAARYAEAARLANAHGLQLGLHNHWWELDHAIDGQTPFDRILTATPAIFSELDVYWCTVAGQKPTDVIGRWKSRLPLLHIKDGDLQPPSPMKAVGKGKLDFPAIVAAADPKTLEWLIVELDECATDMLQAVADSYQYLTSKGLAQGRR